MTRLHLTTMTVSKIDLKNYSPYLVVKRRLCYYFPKSSPMMALRCVALRCVALRCVALRCVALRCVALRCVALRCVALRCVALRCVALRCVALRCVALRCVALRCVALRCVALRCVALHYIRARIVVVQTVLPPSLEKIGPRYLDMLPSSCNAAFDDIYALFINEIALFVLQWCT